MQNWIRSTVFWVAVLLIGGLWFFLADSAEDTVPAVAVVATTAIVGFTWQRSRARASRRKAALDAYAEREIARAAARRHQLHAKTPADHGGSRPALTRKGRKATLLLERRHA